MQGTTGSTASDSSPALTGAASDEGNSGSVNTPDMGSPEFCGNNIVDSDDLCDGTDLAGSTCQDYDFDTGELTCNAQCSDFDFSQCRDFDCGDNMTEGTEQCDGGVDTTCSREGFDNGALSCTASCQFDTSDCGACRNKVIDPAEDCDISAALPQSCNTLGFTTGVLLCDTDCLFDTSGCTVCGNNMIDEFEVCDGSDFPDITCVSEGFDSGTLDCQDNCAVDLSGCGICGNSLIDGDDVCDNNNFDSATCQTLGYDNGTLACSAACDLISEDGCGTCGDGLVEGTQEICDGENLAGVTCETLLGLDGGEVVCSADCFTLDTSACFSTTCGDDAVQDGETCDGTDLNGADCAHVRWRRRVPLANASAVSHTQY